MSITKMGIPLQHINKHYAIETGDSLFLVPWWPPSPEPDSWQNWLALYCVMSISAFLRNEQKRTIQTKLEYVFVRFCVLILSLETGTQVVPWYRCLKSSAKQTNKQKHCWEGYNLDKLWLAEDNVCVKAVL